MSDSEKTSHWDQLASELGANPAASPPPPAPTAPPAAKREYKPVVEPKTAATDWHSLATSLGISTPAEIKTPEEKQAEKKAAEVKPADAPQKATPPPATGERPPAVSSTQSEFFAAEEVSFVRREQQPLPDEVLPRRIELSAAERAVGDLFGFTASTRDVAPAEERPETRPDVKYRDDFEEFDKPGDEDSSSAETSESGDEETGESEEVPARRRRRRRRGRRGRGEGAREKASSEASQGEDDAEQADPFDEIAETRHGEDVEILGDAGAETSTEEGERSKSGRKRRRRGRGRRGRRKEGADAEKGEVNGAALDDFDADDQYDSPNDIPLVSGRDDADADADDEGERGERSEHRNIPTWDEAIGIMIAVNMEARAKSPGGGRSSGPPRGRGRGGRGKRS